MRPGLSAVRVRRTSRRRRGTAPCFRVAETLWDLIRSPAPPPATPRPGRRASPERPVVRAGGAGAGPRRRSMQERYDELVTEMKARWNVRVRKWRRDTSGCAWEVRYENGTVRRLIEAPYPRGPVSCAVFLHEIGHHAIGFGAWRPRCLEEYQAWRWALDTMRRKGLNVTPAVEKRVDEALRYAVRKARRRGIKALPAELVRYA